MTSHDGPPPAEQPSAPAPPTKGPALSPLLPDDPKEIGGYRLVGRIGAGGMGVVYAAAGSGGYIAIKVIHSDHAADPEFRVRFAREVDLARRVVSPRVPAFYGADTQAASPWLATEYVPGRTLREHLTAHGPLRDGMLLGFAAGVAEALRVVHAAGIVHRDLKPGNVILASDGPRVLDFGIARAVEETALTRTGGLVGTPGWIAPEQYQGAEITAAADLFAWASLVAFAATGANPFGSGPPNALAYRVLRGEPDLTGVPEPLLPLLTSALDRDPATRPSAEQAVRAVRYVWDTSTPTPTAEPPADDATAVVQLLGNEWTEIQTTIPPAPRRPGRSRLVALIAGGIAAAVIVLGGGAVAASMVMSSAEESSAAEANGESGDDDNAGEDTGDEDADGAENGDDSSDPDGGDGDGEDEPVELPGYAVDFVSTGGSGANTGEVTETGATARVELRYSDGFAATVMELSEVTTNDDGVEVTARLFQDGANAMGYPELDSAWFFAHNGDEQIPNTATSFIYESGSHEHSETYTLTFSGAEESGLITIDGSQGREGLELPPLSVCYEAGVGFSTDYEDCV